MPAMFTPQMELRETLEELVSAKRMAGAVALLATKDRILEIAAAGFADIAGKRPMEPDSVFWIASQTKAMTVAAFMTLVDEGRASVEEPVEKYLPEFKGQMFVAERDESHVLLKKPSRPVAIRDLLSHTSGLPFRTAIEWPLDVLPIKIAAKSYGVQPLESEPGVKYSYSNAGINAAARIIEVITGISYENFLQERILEPLGMKDTVFRPSGKQLARLAKNYRSVSAGLEEVEIDQLAYPLSGKSRQPMPAGGLFSTAKDVAKFCQMTLGGGVYKDVRVLSEASVKAMTSRQTAPSIKESYGFGWSAEGGKYGHGGACGTFMEIDPSLGLISEFMVQGAGSKEGGDSFRKWRDDKFGGRRKTSESLSPRIEGLGEVQAPKNRP